MNRDEVIERTERFVKEEMEGDPSHDWWHVHRVRNNAVKIGREKGADLFIVRLAALLHDLEDWKFSEGRTGSEKAEKWLRRQDVEEDVIQRVKQIVENVSFEGAGVESDIRTKEGEVVQDADRLDSMGAIGIARCFAYGGSEDNEIYDPEESPEFHDSFDHYRKSESSMIGHFHEKLLLLKDRINTDSARKMAEERHEFMEKFLERFHEEWEGKK